MPPSSAPATSTATSAPTSWPGSASTGTSGSTPATAAAAGCPRPQVGTGWNMFNAIVGPGDFNGDGSPDLLARETSNGVLWLYPGNGRGGLAPPRPGRHRLERHDRGLSSARRHQRRPHARRPGPRRSGGCGSTPATARGRGSPPAGRRRLEHGRRALLTGPVSPAGTPEPGTPCVGCAGLRDERDLIRRRPAPWRPGPPRRPSRPSGSAITAARLSLPRGSISLSSTWIFWPTSRTSSTFSIRLPPTSLRTSEMCSRPSLPGSSETNAPKVGRLHDGAEEPLADLGHLRVGDRVDHRASGLGRRAVGGADVDGAVVLDRDLGAGLVLDLVDHLALRADDLADLVDRDLHADDARRVRRHLVRGVDGLGHDVEDVQARVAGLGQRAGEHRRRGCRRAWCRAGSR